MKGKKIIAPILCLASVATLAACSPVVTDGDNLKDLKTEHVEVVNTNQKLELSVASLNTEIATLRNEKTAIESELAELDSKLETALNEKEVDAKTISELETSIDDLKQELSNKELEINNLNERIKALQNQDYVWTDSGVTAVYDYKGISNVQEDIKLNGENNYFVQMYDNPKFSKIYVSLYPVLNGTNVNREYVGYYKEYDIIKGVDITLKDKTNLLINNDSFIYESAMENNDTFSNVKVYYIGNIYAEDGNFICAVNKEVNDNEVDLTDFFADIPSGKYKIELYYNYDFIIGYGNGDSIRNNYGTVTFVTLDYTSLEVE